MELVNIQLYIFKPESEEELNIEEEPVAKTLHQERHQTAASL